MCINEVRLKSNTCNVNRKIMQGAVHFFFNGTVYGQALVCDPSAVWRLPNDLLCAVSGVTNNVLKKMMTPKRKELTGSCRKVHNGELRDFYSS